MSDIYIYYGIFTLCLWAFTSLAFQYTNPNKFCKKHLKTRKKFFFFFGLLSIALFWVHLEAAVNIKTLEYLWIGNIVLFVLYSTWSGYKIFQDYTRIKSIQKRRKK